MSKQALIDKLTEKGHTKSYANEVVSLFTESVTELLAEGQEVSLIGFGKFSITTRAARTGRNPQTGAEMQIPATKVARFTAGKRLKDAVKDN